MFRLPARLLFSSLLILAVVRGASSQQAPGPFGWDNATFLGGSNEDFVVAVARDSSGYIYVGGGTNSSDFPVTAGAYDTQFPGTPGGRSVPFAAKLAPNGQIIWSTFLGIAAGEDPGFVSSLKVDPSGNVYLAGAGGFVMKLDPSGSTLLYRAQLADWGFGGPQDMSLALDDAGNTYVAAATGTGNNCFNPGWAIYGNPGWDSTSVIHKLAPDGTVASWCLILQGQLYRMVRDAKGFLYVTGLGTPPCTTGAVCTTAEGSAFVMKIDPAQPASQAVVWSAVLGGAGTPSGQSGYFSEGEALAVDAAGNVYVGMSTNLTRLPASSSAFEPTSFSTPNSPVVWDTYIVSLNSAGTARRGSTYISGSGQQVLRDIAVDSKGYIYAAGFTHSQNFLTTAYSNLSVSLGYDGAWYVRLNPSFSAASAVHFGGRSDHVQVSNVALDGSGGLWGVGYDQLTSNAPGPNDFPTTSNAPQRTMRGGADGILFHTRFPNTCGTGATGVAICRPQQLAGGRVELIAQASGSHPFNRMSIYVDGLNVDGFRAQQLDHTYAIASGAHTLRVTAADTAGVTYANSTAFTVTAPASCPLDPIQPSLTLCSPLNAAQVKGTFKVHVLSNTYTPPQKLLVYVDGSLRMKLVNDGQPGNGQPNSYSGSLSLSSGTHRITVQGYAGSDFVKTTTIVKAL